MVPSNTSCQVKGQVPFSLLMRTLGIFMPPRDWTGRSRPIIHSEPKHWTDSPTSLWNRNLSLLSKFRISMTMNPNFWMVHIQQEFQKCLLWVSKMHALFVINIWKICWSVCSNAQNERIWWHTNSQDSFIQILLICLEN